MPEEKECQEYDLTKMSAKDIALSVVKLIYRTAYGTVVLSGVFGFMGLTFGSLFLGPELLLLAAAGGATTGGIAGFIRGIAVSLKDFPNAESQAEIAKNIIRMGKELGVKKIRIKLSSSALLGVGAQVEGIPINVGYKGTDTSEIEVVY